MPSNLQDEIRQTRPFQTRSDEAFVSILRTATILEHEQSEVLRPFGITHTQYNVLRILQGAGKDGLCGREIAERLISRVPDVSRLLDRMYDVDLISRERDTGDRRHVTARITAKGKRMLAETTPALQTAVRRRFRDVGAGSVSGLIDALTAIRNTS
jgi:DNA-binding MarR family transcriptional regulator